jgi:hypothetical protein
VTDYQQMGPHLRARVKLSDMNKPKNCFVFLICFALSGCIFDHGELWRDGPYSVGWIDSGDSLTLSYDVGNDAAIGRVDEKVVAVGSNLRYVVVKQIPRHGPAAINYFYVDRARDHAYADPKDAVSGPFTESEFEKKRAELKLPELSKEFK